MKWRAVLIGALLISPAAADMGQIHVVAQGVSVSESAQKAIILVNGREEVLILGTEMQASRKLPVVRFIPFPSEPKVAPAPKGVFDRMAALVAKYRLEYVRVFHSKGGPARSQTSGVEVRFTAKMGGHDLTVIHVRDGAEIRAWVRDYFKKKHLRAPGALTLDEAEIIVRDYVARGIAWFVVDAVELGPKAAAIEPIAYSFATTSLYYPLLTSNTFGGKGDIELYVLGHTTLCAPGSDVFLDQGDKAVDANGREIGPCLGLKSMASTSAMLVAAERDAETIWPTAEAFFGAKPVFLQAIRYSGPYKFEHDVAIALPQGMAKALAAPEPGDNPFLGALLPQEHAQCKKVPDRGPCKALFERFHFDGRSCKPFIWGGCGGSVPFETLQECEKVCLGK